MKLLVQLFFMFLCMQIYSQVGIGTTSPQAALHVSGDNSQLRVDGLGSANPLNNGVETPLAVDADGKFILSSAPTMEFVAMGKVQADGSVVKIYGATVFRLSEGNFKVSFLKSQIDDDYIVSLTLRGGSSDISPVLRYYDQNVNSFKVNISSSEVFNIYGFMYVGNSDADIPFMFTVYKIN
jgi:hypothetical protein